MQDEPDRSDAARSLLVLVVEDDFLIAMDVEMMLEQEGHRVLGPATSIARALSLLEAGRPDVAVLDVNLHGEVVLPVAARLRTLQIPYVLASAYGTLSFEGHEEVAEAENIGKPIREQKLLEALGRATTIDGAAGPARPGIGPGPTLS